MTEKKEECAHLDGHGGENEQVGEVAAERGEQESKLVAFHSGRRLPWVEVREGGDRDGGAGGDEHEVCREHLALQVPEHVPRQVPTNTKIQQHDNTKHGVSSIDRFLDQKIPPGRFSTPRIGARRGGRGEERWDF